jgi:uncharacterized LabA/DUF88 family protein
MTKNLKTAVFIDGTSLFLTAKSIGPDVDYRKLKKYLEEKYDCFRIMYYAAIPEGDAYSPVRPLVDWLSYNGYTISSKPLRETIDRDGNRHYKGSINVEMTVDMLALAPNVDHIMMFTGESDLRPAVEAVQKYCRVSVVSTIKNSSMIADNLRRQADVFIDLEDIIDNLTREIQQVR